jgi:hypothetical protein
MLGCKMRHAAAVHSKHSTPDLQCPEETYQLQVMCRAKAFIGGRAVAYACLHGSAVAALCYDPPAVIRVYARVRAAVCLYWFVCQQLRCPS